MKLWIIEMVMKALEKAYLRANGWTAKEEAGQEWWIPPVTYLWEKKIGRPHRRGHAVNSQKAADGARKHDEDMARHFREEELKRHEEDQLDED